MDTMKWIQQWYSKQCDGDWEHGYGIKIDTLDNPGWSVKISLEGTELKGETFQNVEVERSENDWIHCKIGYIQEQQGQQFLGYGGLENLQEILNVFKTGIENL